MKYQKAVFSYRWIFFCLKREEDALNEHWSNIRENKEHFSLKRMLQYKSINGIKWNSMKIKCFN